MSGVSSFFRYWKMGLHFCYKIFDLDNTTTHGESTNLVFSR